jgi:hypothetical protein
MIVGSAMSGPLHPAVRVAQTDTGKGDALYANVLSHLYASGSSGTAGTAAALTLNWLKRRFGIGYPAARGLVERLCAEQVIERSGRSYRLCIPAQHGSATILLLSRYPTVERLIRFSPRSPEFWQILARESTVRNIRVALADGTRYAHGAHLRRHGPLLGIWIHTAGLSTAECDGLIAAVTDRDLPVVIYDEFGRVDLRQLVGKWRRSRCITAVSCGVGERCGRDMGHHLMRQGLLHVAWISYVNTDPCYDNRLSGLRSVIAAAGGSVREWTLSYRTSVESEIAVRTKEPYRTHIARERQWRNRVLNAGSLPQAREDGAPPEVWSLFLSNELGPVCREVLTQSGIRAVVAPTDQVAATVESVRRAIPRARRVRVYGFDNSYVALDAGIASYDFNMPDVINTLFDLVVNRSRQPGAPGAIVEPAGMVVTP